MKNWLSHSVLRVTLTYAILAGLWFVLVDRWLKAFGANDRLFGQLQTLGDFAFVALTAGGLYILLWSRRRAEAEREASTARLFSIVEIAPEAIISIDETQRIVFFNHGAEQTFGYRATEVVGRPLSLLLPARFAEGHSGHIQNFAAAPETVRLMDRRREIAGRRKDGVEFPAEASISKFTLDGETTFNVILRDVTERKRAEDALRESEQRQRAIIEAEPECVKLLGPTGIMRQMNPAGLTMVEADSLEQIVGQSCFAMIVSEDRPAFEQTLDRVFQGESGQLEFGMVGLKGTPRWMDGHLVPLRNLEGRVTNALAVTRDITDRKRMEGALRESEEKYRLLIENASEVFYRLVVQNDPLHGQPAFVSWQAENLTGLHAEEFIRNPGLWIELIHPDDLSSVADATQEMARSRARVTRQYRIRHVGSADYHWVEDRIAPQFDSEGKLIGFYGVARDVTQSKFAEMALIESEARYRTLVEQAADGIFVADSQGRYVDVNPSGCAMLGYARDEFLGLTIADLIPTADLAAEPVHWDQLRAGKAVVSERRLKRKDGSFLPVEISAKMLSDGHLQGIVRDITERKRAEAALIDSERRFRALIEHSADGIALVDAAGNELYHSPALQRILGYLPEERVGRNAFEQMHPDEAPQNAGLLAQLVQQPGGVVTAQFRMRHKDGSWRWLEAVGSNLLAEPGVQAIVVNYRDISERHQRERELQAIASVSAALRTAQTRAEMLPIILDQLLDLLDAEGTALALCDRDAGDVVVELGRGNLAHSTGFRVPAGEGITGTIIASAQPYLTNDVQGEPRLFGRELVKAIHAVAGAPLIVQGNTFGVLWFSRQTEIGRDELRLLVAVADIAASAIHRSTLHEQTERRAQYLAALHAIDRAISSSLDLKLTLGIVLDQAQSQLHVDAAAVLLMSQYAQTLEYAVGRGFRHKAIEGARVRLGEGHAGRAALERRTVGTPLLPEAERALLRPDQLLGEAFVAWYAAPLLVKGHVVGVLEVFHRAPLSPDPEWLDFLETLAGQAAIAVDNSALFDNLQRSNIELRQAYDATIEGWSRALDLRDRETEGHTQRVTRMTERLAQAMGLDDAELVQVRRGALLHDMGKVGVPDSVLLKPGTLTDDEWVIMKQHPAFAYRMLSPIVYLKPALDIPYCHHEKWDGTGYPRGLKGGQIPLAARLFAVVDVYDALRSDRPYRAAWPEEKVREHIRSLAGAHFDPQVVEMFLGLQI